MTVSSSNVPEYASACSGTARYISACSCWGVTRSTTMAPTPLTTLTITATATSTSTIDVVATTTVDVTCASPSGLCTPSGPCTDLRSDQNNCGACGAVCSGACVNGVCSSSCAAPNSCSAAVPCAGGMPCQCLLSTSGYSFCVNSGDDSCPSLTCGIDTHCPLGYVCLPDTCCGEGICRKANDCGNAASPARLFKMRRGDGTKYINVVPPTGGS